MDRKLIDYLPLYVQDYAEIKAIMDAEQINVEKAWTDAENVMCDQFILDATENGVKRWESIVGIVPKANLTLEERKFQVLSKLNWQLPYTIESLNRALTTLCGENGYTLMLDADRYELMVKLALVNKNFVDAVKDLLENVVPANLVQIVQLYNTHGIVGRCTHGHLSNYTHDGVREEIL